MATWRSLRRHHHRGDAVPPWVRRDASVCACRQMYSREYRYKVQYNAVHCRADMGSREGVCSSFRKRLSRNEAKYNVSTVVNIRPHDVL